MQLVNEWFYFNNAIPEKICNKIKKLGDGCFESATVDTYKGTTEEERKIGRKSDFNVDAKIRISDVTWTNEQWLIDLIWPYMIGANERAGWNFDIKSVENMQVTKYEAGGFYAWHKDGGADCLSTYTKAESSNFVLTRKKDLSFTLQNSILSEQ